MSQQAPVPNRWIGLDGHKHYLVAGGVDAQLNHVLGPQKVQLSRLEAWTRKTLTPYDSVALEMSTNSFELYDELAPFVHSMILVHPPHVNLIARAQVKTDKKSAFTLARLHAVGLLPSVWVPPQPVRDHRALVSQRAKMVRLSTQAKNRLHAVLHRHHLPPPEQGGLFDPLNRDWWLSLDLSPIEHIRIQSDLDTLAFAQTQVARLEEAILLVAIHDERVLFLIQLPGVGLITAVTLLAAIGDESRFPTAKHLVGYSGLGCRVHDSGLTHRTGRITKAGRRDIRAAMVEAAHTACRVHPHWKAELARLEPRLGHNKAIVVVARKLLVTVWHVLNRRCADRFAEPELVARKLAQHAYTLGRDNRPDAQTAGEYARQQLDRLDIGADLDAIQWGNRTISMPPSNLAVADD
jgi:transposase